MKQKISGKHVIPSVCRLVTAAALLAAMFGGIGTALAAAPAGYTLNWSDEFNGTAIDTSKWRVPNGEDHFGATSDPSLVTVGGGVLSLRGGWINNAMRTGLVDTKGKKYMRYGYYEVRCRQNGGTGAPDTGWPQNTSGPSRATRWIR